MTLNKYNEYMSHIEVTDEMKARVLANVSKAIAEQKTEDGTKADVTPMPVARKKRPVPIAAIISIAATVLIVGGIAIAFLSNAMSSASYGSPKTKTATAAPDTAEQTDAYDNAVEAAGDANDGGSYDGGAAAGTDSYDGSGDGDEWEEEETTAVTDNVTAADTRPAKEPEADIDPGNIQALVPDTSLETSMSVENGTSIITFNAASNSGTLYIADEGMDLASTYLAGTAWNSSNSTSGVTPGGINYALINTKTADTSTYDAASFESDGKEYLIVFDEPVPEESFRTIIEDY